MFISYARRDGEECARTLHRRLLAEAPDIPTWLDRFELEGGVGWWNQIEQELDRAEFLILVMTPAAMQSENTRREWRSARQRGVCVYPVIGLSDAPLDFASLPNWMRKSHFYDPLVEWEKMLAQLRRGCQATRIPHMAPPLPSGYVARQPETQAILDHLLGDRCSPRSVVVALRGPGGFGKTTLAAAVCHDDTCIEVFDDGILWVTLGQAPNLANELVKLYAALTGERPGFVDVEDATRELAFRLESKNCLIVIDDAWSTGHVKPFLQGGPGCSRLITTRRFEVTLDTVRIDIDAMTPSQALELLRVRSGATSIAEGSVRELIARLGCWPLPITLAGAALRQRLERGNTPEKALSYLARSLDKRGITAFDAEKPSSREDAVAQTIGASLDLLSPDEQRRCSELTVFRAEEPIPIHLATALWGLDEIDGEDLARKFDELALIEFDLRVATLRIHDELRGFLETRLAGVGAVHARLVAVWSDPYNLPDSYAWRSYTHHLRHAGRTSTLRALLLDPRWLKAKMAGAGILSLIADFEGLGSDRTLALIRDALRLSAHSLDSDPTQFEGQLVGRLLRFEEPEIKVFRETVQEHGGKLWLQLIHPTLDAPGGILVMTLYGHGRGVTGLAASSDYRTLASISEDGTVRIWDTDDGSLRGVFYDSRTVLGMRAVAIEADGRLALTGGANGVIYMWDIPQGELRHSSRDVRGAITSIALSADGRVALCASRDRELRVLDVQKRTTVHTLHGHSDCVNAVTVAGSGGRAVSASDDSTLRVWNVLAGLQEHVLIGHSEPVNTVALTADGRYALSGSNDYTVRLWDLEAGQCVRTLPKHSAAVVCVALSANGSHAATSSSDRIVRIWDLAAGLLAELKGHSEVVRSIAMSSTGLRVATGSDDGTVKLWNLESVRSPEGTLAHSGPVQSLIFSPDGRLLASGADSGQVKVVDVLSGTVIQSLDADSAPVRSIAFSSDSSCLLTGAVDGRFWLWIMPTGQREWLSVRHFAPVLCFAQSATTGILICACGDRFVYIWDMPSCSRIQGYGTRRIFDHLIPPAARRRELPVSEELADSYLPGEPVFNIHLVRMSPDGRLAVFSATRVQQQSDAVAPGLRGSGAVLLTLNVQTGEIHSIEVSQANPIIAFAVDAAHTRILCARQDHSLELWDLRSEQKLTNLPGHSGTVNALAFSSDGKYVFSCARDRTLRVWDLNRNTTVATFTADSALRSLAVSPITNVAAVGDMAGRVHLLTLAQS